MNSQPQNVTVFTGDLVNSTQLTKAKLSAAFDVLQSCAEKAAEWHGAALQFTRHRGDGWQVILKEPKYALRTALYFRASLKALGSEFDTYIGMATGPAKHDTGEDLNSRNEAVFVRSGLFLDEIKSTSDYDPKLATEGTATYASTVTLADYLSSNWTPPQSETVANMLPPKSDTSFTELAKILGKSRQVVTKSLHAAGYQYIFVALDQLEDNYA